MPIESANYKLNDQMSWPKANLFRSKARSPISDRLELRIARYLLLVWIGLLEILLVFGSAGQVYAGAFTFANEVNGVDRITHPTGYTGTGGDLTVKVCIDPGFPNAAAMETSVQNIVRTFNSLNPTTGNILSGNNNNIPTGQFDFESVALHEVGHCLGLQHPNLGGSGTASNYTISTDGANNVFDLDDGADDVIGSNDDIRGDDVNLHWFKIADNNPFTIAATVDSTTYSRDLADLPEGHSFAANADRNVANELLVPNTEAVMQQIIFTDEARRELNHDDVATILYAMAGLDETDGTPDDYDLKLSYAGMMNSCDIVLAFDDSNTGFAQCNLSVKFINSSDHLRIDSATAFFNTGVNWFFNNLFNTVSLTVNKAGNGSGTVTSSPVGIDCGNDCSESYTAGDSVTLTAMAAAGSIFSGWSGGGCSGTGNCVVNMDADTTVTATFSLPILTVTKAGTGDGTITSSPTGISCDSDCMESYTSGTSVTLTATPVAGSAFVGWSGGGCSGRGTCTVTINADTSVTATFASGAFTLTVTKAGSGDGTITDDLAGISCGSDCTEPYAPGTSVTLTANANAGSSFKAWSGACTGTGTCTVSMSENRSVTATFSKTFTDDPLVAGITAIKRVHITELRQAANQLRAQGGPFTDPTVTAGVTTVKRVHIKELRTALTEAAVALGKSPPNFPTDPTIVPETTVIKAAHIKELRDAVRALE